MPLAEEYTGEIFSELILWGNGTHEYNNTRENDIKQRKSDVFRFVFMMSYSIKLM